MKIHSEQNTSITVISRSNGPRWSMIFATTAGGSTLGSSFGLVGALFGAVFGGAIGYLATRRHAD